MGFSVISKSIKQKMNIKKATLLKQLLQGSHLMRKNQEIDHKMIKNS